MKQIRNVLLNMCLFILIFGNLGVLAENEKYAPGTDIIGYGYDVFGEYANQKSKKRTCLFDYSNFQDQLIGNEKYLVPENIFLENISEHIIKTVSGTSSKEYAMKLSASAGLSVDAMFFSGSVNSSYNFSKSAYEEKYYYTYMDANTKWRISLDTRSMDSLKAMLDPQFQYDVDRMEPEELFKIYGTHYIASAYLGGRADFTSVSTITSRSQTQDLNVAIQAKYKVVSGSSELTKGQSETLKNSKTTTELRVVGGNSEYASNISDYQQYEKWASGIKEMPVLCDFDEDSLRPIWEFASTQERKAQLQAVFKEMLKKYPLPDALASGFLLQNDLYFVRSVAYPNMYWDLNGFNLDAKTKSGRVTIYKEDNGADRFIKIIPQKDQPEYVYFQPQHSYCVADISGGVKTPGAELQLWNYGENNPAQQFKMVEVIGEPDTYYIQNVNSGLYLEAHGENKPITQEYFLDDVAQKWHFKRVSAADMAPPQTNKVYAVQNVAGKRFIDIPGPAPDQQRKGAELQLWDMDYSPDRYVNLHSTVMGDYFYIQPLHSTEVWDVKGASKAEGTPIQLWSKTNSDNQQFKFEYAGEPLTYFIKERNSGKYVDASLSNIDKNGCKIQLYSKNGGDNQKWRLAVADQFALLPRDQKFLIKAAYLDKYWDIPGTGAETNRNGNPIEMYSYDEGADRRYKIIPSGDALWVYIQIQNGGRYLDVSNGSPNSGTKIQIWDGNGSNAQKFAVQVTSPTTFVLRTKSWGAVDISGGLSDDWKKNGAALNQYDVHFHKNQQWQLIYADGPNKGKVYKFF